MDKIREYIMVKDKFSHAKLEEVRCGNWNGELKYTDEIYRMLNSIFKMDSLMTESSYVVALDHEKKSKGVCRIGQGNTSETPTSMQNIFTFLLLTGAAAFVLVHNHVANMPDASMSDKIVTMKASNLANMFDMEFIGHMIIHPCGYLIDGGVMDNTNRQLDEDGYLVDCDIDDEEDVFEEDDDEFDAFEDKTATTESFMETYRQFKESIKKGGN